MNWIAFCACTWRARGTFHTKTGNQALAPGAGLGETWLKRPETSVLPAIRYALMATGCPARAKAGPEGGDIRNGAGPVVHVPEAGDACKSAHGQGVGL